MIIGFSRHGTGAGSGPVNYMTDARRQGREDAPPVVLRGSPVATRDLIDSLDFKHKYTSGVLSFAPEETITPAMEQEFMDRFEKVAFAGLEADQYNILWVRHSHAGHHELHFVTPRVELGTGKSLNIRPPGDQAKAAFDDLRSEINARHGLADPDDPSRRRDIAQPDHELKIAAAALRHGDRPQQDTRLLIDAVLTQRAAQGLIRNRHDVIEHVADLGMQVTREGKNYITVTEPESGARWRLKGGLYEREFDAAGAIEAATSDRERDFTKPDKRAAEQFARRVERHISTRAQYHAQRYAPAAARHVQGIAGQPAGLAEQVYHSSPRNPDPEHRTDLARYLHERLGSDAVSGQADRGKRRVDTPAERHPSESGEPYGGTRHRSGNERIVRGAAEGGESRSRLENRQQQRPENNEVNHDGAGKSLAERIEGYVAAVQRTTQGLRDGAGRLAGHVRAYCTGQRDAVEASRVLERASRNLVEQAPAVREPLRTEQALRQYQINEENAARQAYQRELDRWQAEQDRLAQETRPRRSYGPSM